MATAGDLITEASAQLHGWGSARDRVTPLTNSVTAGALSFTVDAAFGQSLGVSPGVVEIDSELIYISAVDTSTGICTVANGGRGYRGTTAAAHSAGTMVVSSPRFPRIWLFKQLNEVIGSVFPSLYAVNVYQTTVKYPSNTYTLPATTGIPMKVLDAQWQDPVGNWHKCLSYTIDPYDATFRLGSGAMIGRPLRVIYSTQPRTFVDETQDFVAQTGLPLSAVDVMTLGVVAKQVPALDISRAQQTSVEQSDRSRVVPPFAGVNAAKYVMAEYQERLANEAAALRMQFRPRLVRTF